MSFVVQCPHCETRFNLQPDMNGKSMRCPNLECRQVFVVQAMTEKAPPAPVYELPPEPGSEAPAPAARSGKSGKSAKAPKATKPPKPAPPPANKPPKPAKAPPQPAEPEVVEAAVVEATVVSAPKVTEVVWSEGTDVPPPSPKKKGKKPLQPEPVDDDLPVRRRRKHSRRPMILAVLIVFTVGLLLAAGFYGFYIGGKNEEKLAERAKGEYDKGNYGDAAKTYDKLAKDYPGSKDIDKYKFFADLSSMQTVVRGVTNRENYEAAVKRLARRVHRRAQKDEPFAKPSSGYGRDILEAGKKLGEDVAAHAEDRVKAFQADRAEERRGSAPAPDKAIAAGRGLIPLLDPFRAADDPPLDKIPAALDRVERGVKRERDRTAASEKAAGATPKTPNDAVIQSVEADLAAAGFLDDPEAQAASGRGQGQAPATS